MLNLDWAGTEGTVRYPIFMNGPGATEGGTSCALLLKEHD